MSEPGAALKEYEVAVEQAVSDEVCCHYWIIETPNGPSSRGYCKYCGAERDFRNTLGPDILPRRRRPMVASSNRAPDHFRSNLDLSHDGRLPHAG